MCLSFEYQVLNLQRQFIYFRFANCDWWDLKPMFKKAKRYLAWKSHIDVSDGSAIVCTKRKANELSEDYRQCSTKVINNYSVSTPFLCNENIVKMCPWRLFALFSPINRLLDMMVIKTPQLEKDHYVLMRWLKTTKKYASCKVLACSSSINSIICLQVYCALSAHLREILQPKYALEIYIT